MELKEGMVVNVFQKPIEGEQFEGKATLNELYRPDEIGNGLSEWLVEFQDEPGAEYARTINTENALREIT